MRKDARGSSSVWCMIFWRWGLLTFPLREARTLGFDFILPLFKAMSIFQLGFNYSLMMLMWMFLLCLKDKGANVDISFSITQHAPHGERVDRQNMQCMLASYSWCSVNRLLCTGRTFQVSFSGSNKLTLFSDVCPQFHMTCSAWQFFICTVAWWRVAKSLNWIQPQLLSSTPLILFAGEVLHLILYGWAIVTFFWTLKSCS
jgi:hypothetical protein